MKVYILIDTEVSAKNEVLGVYSNEILAKNNAIDYTTPENGIRCEMDDFALSLLKIKEFIIDERLFNQ